MELSEIVSCYSDRWVILSPQEYNEKGFVILWEILDEASNFSDAKTLRSNYENWCNSDVVIYDTHEREYEGIASIVAHFFRVMYGEV